MPKKFKGENSKASEARARKAQQRDEEKQRKDKEIEDAYWKDDDKHVARKQQRKDEKEQKRLEQLERKKELQKLHDEEMSNLKSASGSSSSSSKMTRAMIAQRQEEERLAAEAAAKKEQERVHHEIPIEENVNRLIPTEGQARNVEDAISVLSVKEAEVDRHPEKRLKAAYNKFEEENLPKLKQENPNLRLSQLKQMIRKDWMKSPDNPLNQRLAANN